MAVSNQTRGKLTKQVKSWVNEFTALRERNTDVNVAMISVLKGHNCKPQVLLSDKYFFFE